MSINKRDIINVCFFFKILWEKKHLKEKNKMKRELSSCVIQKFNGYELLRNDLNYSEKKKILFG